MVKIANKFFERTKTRVAFIYPDLDLCHFSLFKVIRGGQLLNEEDALDQESTLITLDGVINKF